MRSVAARLAWCLVVAHLGCASYHSYAFPLGETRHGARPASDVPILERAPDRRHEIVGKAHSHCRRHLLAGGCARAELERRLAQEGARLGAEGVYDVRETRFDLGTYTEIDLYGTAIRRHED